MLLLLPLLSLKRENYPSDERHVWRPGDSFSIVDSRVLASSGSRLLYYEGVTEDALVLIPNVSASL